MLCIKAKDQKNFIKQPLKQLYLILQNFKGLFDTLLFYQKERYWLIIICYMRSLYYFSDKKYQKTEVYKRNALPGPYF